MHVLGTCGASPILAFPTCMQTAIKVDHGGDKLLKHGTEKDFYSYNVPCHKPVECKKCLTKMRGKNHVQCELGILGGDELEHYHLDCWYKVVIS